MLSPLALFALTVVVTAEPPCTVATAPADTTLQALYEAGQTFPDFLDEARRRRAAWHANFGEAETSRAVAERLRAVPGSWKLLVVAIDGCSDSVSTIPYIARLVESVESLDMRIVDSAVGRTVMETHPTPDGRAATPTLVLLDGEWNEAGCFVERPQPLVAWLEENGRGLGNQAYYEAKMGWYAEDAGTATVHQLVEMVEAAGRGEPICR